jgi:hypothetical protein
VEEEEPSGRVRGRRNSFRKKKSKISRISFRIRFSTHRKHRSSSCYNNRPQYYLVRGISRICGISACFFRGGNSSSVHFYDVMQRI